MKPNLYICHTAYQVLVDLLRASRTDGQPHTMVLSAAVPEPSAGSAEISRAELARATGMTRAAASLIAEELLNAGVVTELAPQSAGRGRSATPLVLRPDSYYALAVDLARKGCTVGLCDIGGKLLQCRELPEQGDMVAAIIGALASQLETVDKSRILGIGISAPGPLDCESGRILNPPRFERWHGVDIGKRLSSALGLPAYLEHDVCAMALHQQNTGCSRNFMLLFIDIGIGAAIVSDGELLGNFTGELGHTTIRFDGRLCECGNRGCLETYASIPALLEGSGFRDWFDLVDHADEPEARRLLDQEAVYLSAGLINLLNLIPVVGSIILLVWYCQDSTGDNQWGSNPKY